MNYQIEMDSKQIGILIDLLERFGSKSIDEDEANIMKDMFLELQPEVLNSFVA